MLEGRWGPYVTDGTTNASLPRGVAPEELDLERAIELLREREARGPSKRPAKKAATKKSATKKSAAKKSTARKSTTSKSTTTKTLAKKTAAKTAATDKTKAANAVLVQQATAAPAEA